MKLLYFPLRSSVILLIILCIPGCDLYDRLWKGFFCVLSLGNCECIYHEDSETCKVDATNGTSPGRQPLISACICRHNANDVRVFFDNKPSIYKKFPKDPVYLYSSRCKNIDVCPVPISIITGKLYSKIEKWTQYDDWVGDGDYWYFDGVITNSDGKVSGTQDFRRKNNNIYLDLASTGNNIILAASNLQCEEECKNDSIYCSKINKDSVGKSTISSLRQLNNKFMLSIGNTIKKSEIMQMFAIKKDPCNRGDVDLRNGKVKNSGDICNIQHKVDFGLGDSVLVKFNFPDDLEAELLENDNSFELNFSVEEKSAVLEIKDEGLNIDYGGRIKNLSINKGSALFSTENGCISLSY